MKVLITGTSGFIGYHLANRLLKDGHEVVGYDVINDYYDPTLKFDRLKSAGIDSDSVSYGVEVKSQSNPNYSFIQGALEDAELVGDMFASNKFDAVVNLAAQAGVRYSIQNPKAYMVSNIDGFLNILEGCRHSKVGHLVYASSSSVYGLNSSMPFSIHDNVDHPISLYAASKKANELMAHTYSHLYGVPSTGLRFFTVYGPWGRPDMALFIFTKAILEGKPIKVFNHGNMQRDFTYIDDIVEGITRVLHNTAAPNPDWTSAKPDPGTSVAPYRIYNIGNNSPVRLMDFIEAIEESLGMEAQKDMMPIQPGDVPATYANVDDLISDTGFKPETSIKVGVSNFVNWYREYYKI